MGDAREAVAFLTNSPHRVAILRTLADDPHTRRELVDGGEASRPTVGRILGEFEARAWVERDDQQYRLTALGEHVLEALVDLLDAMAVERTLRTVVRWLPVEQLGIELGWFDDAVVTVPEPGRSHRPLTRFVELVEDATVMRGFGIATLAPTSAEALFGRAGEGVATEIVYPPAVLEEILTASPDHVAAAVEARTLATFVHPEPPCGLYVLEDRVVLGGYDRGTGVLRAVDDTDDPAAVEWGRATYRTVRDEARAFDVDEYPAAVRDCLDDASR